MSDVSSHQNPSLQTPHKIKNNNNKHSLVKTKPTKRLPRSSKNKTNNNNINNNTTNATTDIQGVNSNTNNSKPLKVVHISNPMKFEVTPTEFRDLVHRLTGRDAVVEDWCTDDYHHHRVNHQPTVAVSVDGDGTSSSIGGVTDDNPVVQELHQVNNTTCTNHGDDEAVDVTSFATCFTPSDHISFDCFESFHHGYIDEDFRVHMGDN